MPGEPDFWVFPRSTPNGPRPAAPEVPPRFLGPFPARPPRRPPGVLVPPPNWRPPTCPAAVPPVGRSPGCGFGRVFPAPRASSGVFSRRCVFSRPLANGGGPRQTQARPPPPPPPTAACTGQKSRATSNVPRAPPPLRAAKVRPPPPPGRAGAPPRVGFGSSPFPGPGNTSSTPRPPLRPHAGSSAAPHPIPTARPCPPKANVPPNRPHGPPRPPPPLPPPMATPRSRSPPAPPRVFFNRFSSPPRPTPGPRPPRPRATVLRKNPFNTLVTVQRRAPACGPPFAPPRPHPPLVSPAVPHHPANSTKKFSPIVQISTPPLPPDTTDFAPPPHPPAGPPWQPLHRQVPPPPVTAPGRAKCWGPQEKKLGGSPPPPPANRSLPWKFSPASFLFALVPVVIPR